VIGFQAGLWSCVQGRVAEGSIWNIGDQSPIGHRTRAHSTRLKRTSKVALSCRTQSAQEIWLRRSNSSALRSSSTDRAESRTVSGRDDPGIGMTTGAAASIHASVTCWGLTP